MAAIGSVKGRLMHSERATAVSHLLHQVPHLHEQVLGGRRFSWNGRLYRFSPTKRISGAYHGKDGEGNDEEVEK